MLNKQRDRTNEEFEKMFQEQLEPKTDLLNPTKHWGRYKYIFRHNATLTPLDKAVKWFLRLKGYDRLILDWNDKFELWKLDNLMDTVLKNDIKGWQPLLGEGELL